MYQATASWARNNGIDLYKDSAVAPINQIRRLSNALSSSTAMGAQRPLAIDISDVTSARTVKEMQIDEMNKVYATFEGRNPALWGKAWRSMEGVHFDGERFLGPSGTALDDKALTNLIKANDPAFEGGVGLATLKGHFLQDGQ